MNSSGGRVNMIEEMNWGLFNYFNDESFISSNQNQFLNSPSLPFNSNIIPSPGSYYGLVFKEEEANVSNFNFQSQITHTTTPSSISGIKMELESMKSQVVEWDVKNQVKQIDFSKETRKIEPQLVQSLQTHSNLDPFQATKEQSRFEDGYNWRKYGQKQVKGSNRPRSYFKCNYPDCPTKKKVEKDLNGYITEVIYKGKHNHPMPQNTKKSSLNTSQDTILEKSRSESSSQNSLPSFGEDEYDDQDSSNSKSHNDHENEPKAKRWKLDEAVSEAISSIGSKSIQETKVVIETKSEIDILDDGYKWKKYGQKVVKGNPNPRSYYKCTNIGCPVRKLVERASHDFHAVITTYEGKHNHGVPTRRGSVNDTTKQLSMTKSNNNYVPMTYAVLPDNVREMRLTNDIDQTNHMLQTFENSKNDRFAENFYPNQDWERDAFLSTVKKELENDFIFKSYLD